METPNIEIKLTHKQEAFCLAYVENGGNATQACYDAGYSSESESGLSVEGYRLLRNAKICQRIKQIRAGLGELGLVTTEYVVASLVEVAERCMVSRMATDRAGNELGFYAFNPKEAIAAFKALGETVGAFTKKVELSGGFNTTLSESERASRITEILNNGRERGAGQIDSDSPLDVERV